MICKQLVVCLALVPALVVAESFHLGGCGDFKGFMDDNANTQQGINTLKEFFSGDTSMYLWDPSPIEANQSCNVLSADLTAKTFTYGINSHAKQYTGAMKYVLSPQVRLELNGTLPDTILGANNKGFAAWYPIYISSSDVVFIACRPAFLGRRETIYLLTKEDYTGLNTTCAEDAVRTTFNRKLKYVPSISGGATNCSAD